MQPELTADYALRVERTDPIGTGAVAVTLSVPDELASVFGYRAGQHLEVRHRVDGVTLRRNYSICPPPGSDAVRLVIERRRPGGFADHAVGVLRVGDVVQVGPPHGRFALMDSAAPGHHVFLAGGSGITVAVAVAADALRRNQSSRVSLLHLTRTAESALLADELAELKDAHLDRLTVLHVLSREDRGVELLSGRPDEDRLNGLFAALGVSEDEPTFFYPCGSPALVRMVLGYLRDRGVAASRVRTEAFTGPDVGRSQAPPSAAPVGGVVSARVRLAGRTSAVQVAAGETLLDAALRVRPETPWSCREGFCGSCRALVVSGSVLTQPQPALNRAEIRNGFTLLCRARPADTAVELDLDA